MLCLLIEGSLIKRRWWNAILKQSSPSEDGCTSRYVR